MGTYRQIVDVAVDRYREDLEAAIAQAVRAACAEDFTAAERRLASLTQALSSELVRRVVQQVCDDPRRRKEAMERVREKAKGIAMHAMGRRRTPFRTLSGDVVEVTAPYAMAKPRGGKREKRGQDGTGVYPVLDQLGIEGRSTPALRLLVSRALCEANSVTAARELLALGGVAIDHKAALRLTYKVSDTALRAREEAVRTTTTVT